METSEQEWMSLERYLLMPDGPSIGDMASAIERGGVWGLDRYGRFLRFEGNSREALEALDALAQQYAFVSESHLRDPSQYEEVPLSPLEKADEFSPFIRYGWPGDRPPEFGGTEATHPPVPSALRGRAAGGTVKGANADLRVIGALYAVIRGDDGGQKHPEFTTQAALIELLVKRYGGATGITHGNLTKKLPQALKELESALGVPSANTSKQ